MKKLLLLISLTVLFAFNGTAQTTVTLQPDSTSGNSAFLSNWPDDNTANTNFYGEPDFDAVAWTQTDPFTVRSLVQFDLSSIPNGATITSATLTLYNNPTSTETGGQHSHLSGSNAAWLQRVTSSWDQHTVTWNTQPSTTTVDEASLPEDTNPSETYIVDVTALTKDMVDSSSSSFGFMLLLKTEQYYRSLIFASCYNANSALHPKLVITYTNPNCLVLQPDSSTGNSAFISNWPDDNTANTNFYPEPDFDAVAWTQTDPFTVRSLVQFDLSSIPNGATITSATLTLYNNPTSTETGGQHSHLSGSNAAWLQRVTSSWDQHTVTWNTQPSTTTMDEAALPQDTNPSETYIVDVTALTQDMIDNSSSSFGFMLLLQTEQYYRSLVFASCYNANSALHPKIEICYTIPNCVVLQPDSSTGNSAFLSNWPDNNTANTNFYPEPDFDAVAWTQTDPFTVRSLVQFDLSSIPNGTTITSSTLTLYNNPTSTETGGQHSHLSGSNAAWLQRVTSSWDQHTVTWNTQPSTTTVDEASLPEDTNPSEIYIVDVTALTQDMIDSSSSSFGFMLLLQTEQYYRSLVFASCYNANSALHPKLEVCYAPLTTGLPELKSVIPNILVYPNPAADQLTIKTSNFHSNEGITVSIVNMLGEIMKEERLMWTSDINININNLAAGMYFLQMKTESGNVVKRFVKE